MKCEEVRKRMQQINVELEKISLMELKFPKGDIDGGKVRSNAPSPRVSKAAWKILLSRR